MTIYIYSFLFLFTRFLIYSIVGWFIEVCVSYNRYGRFINRGFLIGPYVPIYGVCAIVLTYFFRNETNPIYILVLSMVIASVIEYITSYIMEKLFKVRWWDYSDKPFNINGRVYLINSFGFGFLGYILINLIDPKITFYLSSIDPFWFTVVMVIVLFLFIFDVILSFNIMQKIKSTAACVKKDYTEEITKKVKKILYDKSRNFRRIFDAFPNVYVFNKHFKKK